jgi:SulP family sulfate permease
VLIYRFDAPLFFANANTFQDVLLDYKSQRTDKIHSIILDFESINSIDSSALTILEQTIAELNKEGIAMMITEVKGPVRDKLFKSGLMQKLGEHHFFISNQEALHYIQSGPAQDVHKLALQTNVEKKS